MHFKPIKSLELHNPFNGPVFNKNNYTIIDQQSQTLLCWQLHIWTNLIPLRRSCFVRLELVLYSKCYNDWFILYLKGCLWNESTNYYNNRQKKKTVSWPNVTKDWFCWEVYFIFHTMELTWHSSEGNSFFGEFDLKYQWRKWTQNFINFDPFMTLFTISTELSFVNLCNSSFNFFFTSSYFLTTSVTMHYWLLCLNKCFII